MRLDHWPACGFVVTSRRAAWARTPALGARFLPVSVLGMRGPERELYVQRWFRAVVRHFYGAVDPRELAGQPSRERGCVVPAHRYHRLRGVVEPPV